MNILEAVGLVTLIAMGVVVLLMAMGVLKFDYEIKVKR